MVKASASLRHGHRHINLQLGSFRLHGSGRCCGKLRQNGNCRRFRQNLRSLSRFGRHSLRSRKRRRNQCCNSHAKPCFDPSVHLSAPFRIRPSPRWFKFSTDKRRPQGRPFPFRLQTFIGFEEFRHPKAVWMSCQATPNQSNRISSTVTKVYPSASSSSTISRAAVTLVS